MDVASYQNKPEILILNLIRKSDQKSFSETNKIKMGLFYSYDKCCKETILKLIYLKKCIIK